MTNSIQIKILDDILFSYTDEILISNQSFHSDRRLKYITRVLEKENSIRVLMYKSNRKLHITITIKL